MLEVAEVAARAPHEELGAGDGVDDALDGAERDEVVVAVMARVGT